MLIFAASALASGNIPESHAITAGMNGKIVYPCGGGFVCAASPDGTRRVPLGNVPPPVFFARWSPDGSKIIFVAKDGEDTEIYSMDFDGTDLEELTSNRLVDTEPSFGVLYQPDIGEPEEASDVIKLGPPQVLHANSSFDREPKVGDQLMITASAANTTGTSQSLFVTIEVKDAEGAVQYAAWQSGTVKEGGTLHANASWTPGRAGTYHLTISALAGSDNQALSQVSSEITIASSS